MDMGERKTNGNVEKEEITFPLDPYMLQGQQALPNCKPVSFGCPSDARNTQHLHLIQPTQEVVQEPILLSHPVSLDEGSDK